MADVFSSTVPSRPLGFGRILVGVAALGRGAIAVPVLGRIADEDRLAVPYSWWPLDTTSLVVVVILILWFAAAIAFTVGWRTPISGTVLTATLFVALFSDQQAYGNHLYLMAVLVGLLTLADSGAALSLDGRAAIGRSRVAAWPVLLIKVQISVVYGFAALTKLADGDFVSGSVLSQQLGGGPIDFPDAWRTEALLRPLAMAVIVLELLVALGLWSPRLRRIAVGSGVVLHVGILVFLPDTPELAAFALELVALYPLFLEVEPRSRMVVWDSSCGFCAASVGWLERIDGFRVHRTIGSDSPEAFDGTGITPEAADRAVQLVTSRGAFEGFDAVRMTLELSPYAYPFAPFLGLPGVRHLGHRLYRMVAARRRCALAPLEEARPKRSGR